VDAELVDFAVVQKGGKEQHGSEYSPLHS
jgi:hypothetical protein